MKTILLSVVATFVAAFFTSCAVPVPGGQVVVGGQQYGGYLHQQSSTSSRNAAMQRFQEEDRRVMMGGNTHQGQQHIGEMCFLRIGGAAPQQITQAVENAACAEIQSRFAKSCFAKGGRGEWSALSTVNEIVASLYKEKGYNLTAGEDRQKGCFKVFEYRPGIPAPAERL